MTIRVVIRQRNLPQNYFFSIKLSYNIRLIRRLRKLGNMLSLINFIYIFKKFYNNLNYSIKNKFH